MEVRWLQKKRCVCVQVQVQVQTSLASWLNHLALLQGVGLPSESPVLQVVAGGRASPLHVWCWAAFEGFAAVLKWADK